ncbi:MAG: hypothetical protein IMZ62_02360 [Chloroflexi bacterium]|nr:hypothetical protein [Chloroflexota bacterium]
MTNDLAKAYVLLSFGIEEHITGYVDAYFGPVEWRKEARDMGMRPLVNLSADLAELAQVTTVDAGIDPTRKQYLAGQLKAMQTSLSMLQGLKLPLADETEALYGVRPEWVDESIYFEAHQALDELLPPGGTLPERMAARNKALEVPVEKVRELLPMTVQLLRQRTRARFPLPEDESFEVVFVHDKPWGGYNYFLGGGRSRIELNTDLPMRITGLLNILAHEGYPGHHTELSIKEARLVEDKGWLEFSINPLFTPFSLLSEGIATRALDQLLTDEEQIVWEQEVLFPQAGFAHLDARREHTINHLSRRLFSVRGNASFLLHDRGASPQETSAYLMRWGLENEQEASKNVEFFTHYRSYIFNYYLGRQLLDALLDNRHDSDRWFTRLLSEPVTPALLRSWIDWHNVTAQPSGGSSRI